MARRRRIPDGKRPGLAWYSREHSIKQPLFLALARVERWERVRQAQEIGSVILLGLEEISQRVRLAAALEQHRCVHAVERGGFPALDRGLTGSGFRAFLPPWPLTFGTAVLSSSRNNASWVAAAGLRSRKQAVP